MIREDYVLGWIKRFVRLLAEIAGLVKADQHRAAAQRIDLALRELLGLGADSLQSLSEGEIMARLTLGEATQLVREKCLILATLLDHLGTVLAGQDRHSEARECLLKALHILLGIMLQPDNPALPEYAPRVETLCEKLANTDLPSRTYAALMLYHEQIGLFAKAEDDLFALREAAPTDADVVEMGVAFYQRLLARDDAALDAGNLPRAEIEAGLAELRSGHPST
jgi:hypothetical protein